MKKVTIILGGSGSGKTTLAKKIAEGRKALFLSSSDLESFARYHITEEAEIIIVEEAWLTSEILDLVCCDSINVNKQGLPVYEIACPDLVFTSNCLKPKDFQNFRHNPNVQIIELKKF